MLFNSIEFAIFFPLVAALHFALPDRVRWAMLLLASVVFYGAWDPRYLLLLGGATLISYLAGRALDAAVQPRVRRGILAAAALALCTPLFFYKYYNFLHDSLDAGLAALGLALPVPRSPYLLPVGISFFTFQTLSYAIDVYRRDLPAERHLGRYALFVSFFPQLVAGPIERASNLLPQLRAYPEFDYVRVSNGLKLMTWGLLKKAVIADRLAEAVDYVYAAPGEHSGPALALATVFFAFQIYCDFSGYSDIAVGAAQVLGVRIMTNFRAPYLAASVTEFWRRWHISLSTWFRDYVYLPLGGNRATAARASVNILLVFLLSGLWHGAGWTFVCWGLVHGLGLAAERAAGLARTEHLPPLRRALRTLVTFLFVCAAWVLFRAESLADAASVCAGLFRGWGALLDPAFYFGERTAVGLFPRDLLLAVALIAGLLLVEAGQRLGAIRPWLARQALPIRWALYSGALWTIFLFGVLRQKEFIYFVF